MDRHPYLTTLVRSILYKAYREDLLDTAPKFPRFKRLKPRDRWLTIEEEHRLVGCAARHLVPIIRFAVDRLLESSSPHLARLLDAGCSQHRGCHVDKAGECGHCLPSLKARAAGYERNAETPLVA